MIFSIFMKVFRKYFILILLLAVATSIFGKNISTTAVYSVKVIVYTFIVVVFLLRLSGSLVQSGKLNIYYVILILYILSIILKFITALFDMQTGAIYFYLTSAFQILLAVFFILFNVNSEKVQLNITSRS